MSFIGAKCPHCQGIFSLVESNYHGTNVDMIECQSCHRVYSVSYKIDKLTREPDWEDHD